MKSSIKSIVIVLVAIILLVGIGWGIMMIM